MKTSFPKPPTPIAAAGKIADQLAKKLTTTLPGIIKRLPEPPFVVQKKVGEKLRDMMPWIKANKIVDKSKN